MADNDPLGLLTEDPVPQQGPPKKKRADDPLGLLADTTATPPRPADPLGLLSDEPVRTPAATPTATPVVTPAPRRGIAASISDALGAAGSIVKGAYRMSPLGQADEAIYGHPETEQIEQAPDRRTPAQRMAEEQASMRSQITRSTRPDVSSAAGEARVRGTRPGETQTEAQAAQRRNAVLTTREATEAANFSPEKWATIAARGRELAARMRNGSTERNDAAAEVERKARNADRLARGASDADTEGAIALSNLLGIVSDPYQQQRENIAGAAQPGATFSPEETEKLTGERTAAARGGDVGKDVVAPLAGQLPLFMAGGAGGRVLAAGGEELAGRAGFKSIADALGKVVGAGEEAAVTGPKVPFRLDKPALAGARIGEEINQLRAAAPEMVKRGATQGQVTGAILTYRQARENGATPEQAIGAAAEGVGFNALIGIGAELGLGVLGRAAGVGYDPVGRLIHDASRGDFRVSDRAEITRPPNRMDEVARRQQLGDIGQGLDTLLGEKVRAGEAGPAAQGPAESLVRPDESSLGFRRGSDDAPLPSAREAGLRRAGVETPLRPTDEFNAVEQMKRQREAERAQAAHEAADPNLALERAAQERPTEVQGPRTLEETLADTKTAADRGEPIAGEYRDAIDTYADALAAVKDVHPDREPGAQLQVKLARARAALNAAREKYGKQLGASAVLALAANNDDLTDDEKQMVGLGAVALTTGEVVKHLPREERVRLGDATRQITNREGRLSAAGWLDRIQQSGMALTPETFNAAESFVHSRNPRESALAMTLPEFTSALTADENNRAEPLYSRLRAAVEDSQQFPKKWDEPRPAADWIGKLKGSSTFSKKELALILPELEARGRGESQLGGTKVTRAEVLDMIEARAPRIERVTLSETAPVKSIRLSADADRGDADDIIDLDDVLSDHGEIHSVVRDQIKNREARIADIDEEIDSAITEAKDVMDSAGDRQEKKAREIEKTLEKMKVRNASHVLDQITDYVNEHVSGDEYFGDRAKLMEMIQDDLYDREIDHEQLLTDEGYTINEEPTFIAEIKTGDGTTARRHVFPADELFTDQELAEGGITEERARKRIEEQNGDDLIPDSVSEGDSEHVVRDSEKRAIARGDDKYDVMREAVDDQGLDGGFEEGMGELDSDVETYIEASMEWSRAEREHYDLEESPENRFSDEIQEKEQLADEIGTLKTHLATLPDEATPEQRVRRAAREEAAAAAPEEEPRVTPPVKGRPQYATYQRIGGGRNYRELPSVLENPTGGDYDQNHFARSARLKNVAGHIRVEEHAVHETPGLSSPAVEYTKGEPERERVVRSQIGDVRKQRADALARAGDAATDFENLSAAQQDDSDTRATFFAKFNAAHQQAADLSTREDALATELRGLLQDRGQLTEDQMAANNVHVMLESQMDWAQDATKHGVYSPEREIAARAEVERAVAAHDAIYHEWRKVVDADNLHEPQDADYLAERKRLNGRLEEAALALGDARDRYATAQSGIASSPFTDTATAAQLNAARFLLDVAERKGDELAWSDSANRIANAWLPPKAAKLVYDELTPSAMRKLLGGLGFKDVKIDKLYIKGNGHWHLTLTPEMRKAIKRVGLPILSVMALTPDDADAQGTGGSSDRGLYASAVGGIAAGAALMYLAKNRSARRLVHENRQLARELMTDDLSGLSNKRALMRAQDGVDHDENYGWVVMDGDNFKKLNDTHGHGEGDKAIAHFGETLRNASVELGIPLRAFRAGGDEFAFAAPKEKMADLARYVEQHSEYTKGDVTTKLSAGMGDNYAEADAAMYERKLDRKAGREQRALDEQMQAIMNDPRRYTKAPINPMRDAAEKLHIENLINETRGDGGEGSGGATFYANPIGPALRSLAKYPSAAGIAALGVALGQSDNKDLQNTSPYVIGLAALSAIGSKKLIAGKNALVDATVGAMKQMGGENVVRFFNPEKLLHPSVLEAINQYERDRSRATARAGEFSRTAKNLGPEGDRAVSDVIENEQWEDTSNFTPDQLKNVLSVASAIDAEYEQSAKEQLATGARQPGELIKEGYAGPRRYAAYEAEAVQQDGSPALPKKATRIGATKTRTLDQPIREAEAALQQATASGDPAAITAAQDALDQARVVQMSQRTQLGEIREQSYRAAQGLEQGYANAAAARLFTAIRAVPGSVHPEWEAAITDLQTAKQMKAAATTPADRDAAQQMINQATVDLDEVSRRFKRKDAPYVTLPDTKGLGMLRGAVVKRDIAHSLTGFTDKTTYTKLLRAWKELKTVFNPGTHIANVVSNFGFAHMEGLLLHEQPAYLKRALADMKSYGPATRALAEAGLLDHNVVTADAQGVVGRNMRSLDGLEDLRQTTRPETRTVLEDRGITAAAARSRRAVGRLKGAVAGAALGAATEANNENPEDAALGAAVGAGVGALASGRMKSVRDFYNNEDNYFRVAIHLKKIADGMSPDDALRYSAQALGRFRTRSPALNLVRSTVSPFIMYPAKAVPRFAQQMIDHPWRYMALVAAWGALNEYAEQQVGEVPDADIGIKDRTQSKWGYFFPGFTQLPTTDESGGKGATDMSRWTPLSGVTTGAPPGSSVGALSEDLPAILQPSGPFLDAAAKAYGNVDPQTGQPRYKRDYPPGENISKMLNDAAETALPPALGFHRARLQQDMENRDPGKFATDILGPTGLRPRYVRPGANIASALHQLQTSLSDMKFDFKKDVTDNKNPERVPVLVNRYLKRRTQAIQNFTRRTGSPPPADLVPPAGAQP